MSAAEVPPLSAEEIAIDSLHKACVCLYLEVPARIADDVRDKANAVISQLRAARAERVELEARLREAEGCEAQLHEMRASIIDAVRFTMKSFDSGNTRAGYGGLRSIIGIVEAHEPAALQSAQTEQS